MCQRFPLCLHHHYFLCAINTCASRVSESAQNAPRPPCLPWHHLVYFWSYLTTPSLPLFGKYLNILESIAIIFVALFLITTWSREVKLACNNKTYTLCRVHAARHNTAAAANVAAAVTTLDPRQDSRAARRTVFLSYFNFWRTSCYVICFYDMIIYFKEMEITPAHHSCIFCKQNLNPKVYEELQRQWSAAGDIAWPGLLPFTHTLTASAAWEGQLPGPYIDYLLLVGWWQAVFH